MKYLRKIFESEADDIQYDEIYSIFGEFIENKEGKISSVKNTKPYILIEIFGEHTKDVTNIDDIDTLINNNINTSSTLRRLKVSFSRIDYLKYKWNMNTIESSFFIKIFRENHELTLYDVFCGITDMKRVDQAICKKVLKDKYNLEFTSCNYDSETSGYYGKRAKIRLYFRNIIPVKTHDLNRTHPNYCDKDHKLLDDLRALERKNIYHPEDKNKRAFYSVEAHNWEDSSMISVEIY